MNHPHKNKLNPKIQRLVREFEEAWKRQDFQRGISLLGQAIAIEPSNPILHLNLARAYGERYDYAAVERCIEKALEVSQGNVQMIQEAARICSNFKHLDMMMRYLERASGKRGVSIPALTSLADLYVLDERLDEAAEMVERAARMDRQHPRVLLGESVLKRKRGQIKEAESVLRDLMASSVADMVVRIRAAYDLAEMLDREGQYDEAMTALLEAKALQRPATIPMAGALQHLQSLDKEVPRTVTAAVMDRWRVETANQPPRRIALLTGHPRSGTTLLEQVLDAHSDVISLEETTLIHDEILRPLYRDFPPATGIFQVLDSAPPSVRSHLRENYFHSAEMYLREPVGSRLLVDKNPGINLIVPVLLRVFPETKFLIALRDPRDVVMSCFMQSLTPTAVSSSFLSLQGTVNQYASVMGFWLEMLPRMENQWLYVRYEEMIDDLPAVARSALEFLELNFEDDVLKFFEHARTKRVKSPSSVDVRKPLYRTAVGRWKNYEKYLEPYLPGLERFVKEFGYE
jgi:tetratricopeptide (TPR) repeat protein